MVSPEVDRLNYLLATRYGSTLNGAPHFRIVWSEDLEEVRVGDFNEFQGGIFIRTFHGAKKVRKYNYIRDRWILEMWKQSPPMKELPEPDNFEPLFVFEDCKGNALPPVWMVCELICHTVLNPAMDDVQTKNYIEDLMEKQQREDVEYFYDMFDMSAISSLLHTREAIFLKKGLN